MRVPWDADGLDFSCFFAKDFPETFFHVHGDFAALLLFLDFVAICVDFGCHDDLVVHEAQVTDEDASPVVDGRRMRDTVHSDVTVKDHSAIELVDCQANGGRDAVDHVRVR